LERAAFQLILVLFSLIQTHLQKCDHMFIKCSNEHCDVMKPRMEMTNHLEQECEWREVLCPDCKQTNTFCELEVTDKISNSNYGVRRGVC
jgi:phage FluMu protein Com